MLRKRGTSLSYLRMARVAVATNDPRDTIQRAGGNFDEGK
jgi:hypothetical protein